MKLALNINAREALFAAAAILVMTVVLVNPAVAQASVAGEGLLDTLKGLITGKIGTFIGLFVVVLGLWTWVIKQEAGAGITMIIGGVLITLAPSIFDGTQKFLSDTMDTFTKGANTNARTGIAN